MEIEANLIPRGINLVSLQNYFVIGLYLIITQTVTYVRVCVGVRLINRVRKQSINCVLREERDGDEQQRTKSNIKEEKSAKETKKRG
jgi:hypothetical protein